MSDTWDAAPLAADTKPAPSWDSAPLSTGPSTQQRAVVSANDNADEAAKAVKLGRTLNLPPTVVQSDLPGYDAHNRTQSAKRAVENPAIARYVDSNPMAAKVSGDDYDKLDEVSQTLYALHPELIRSKAQGGLFQAIPEVASLLQSDAGIEKLTNSLVQLPYHLAKGVYDFGKSLVTTPGRVYSEGMTSSDDEAISLGIGIALGAGGAKGTVKVGRPVGKEGMLPGGETVSFDDFMATLRGMKTRKEIDDFIAAKTGGPPGAMLQIEHAKAGAEALDRAVETAQGSKTKERSPEMFEQLAAAHDDGVVHVDASKIMELYSKEGKVPAEGDGLFGFVPGIEGKLRTAAATGGEVSIPISKYIAHVDPAVHEGLKESVRLHDDGVTLEEAKEAQEQIIPDEKISQATVSFDNGEIFTGVIHADAVEGFIKVHPDIPADKVYSMITDQGFLTSTGRRVTREEAKIIADRVEQGISTDSTDNRLQAEDIVSPDKQPSLTLVNQEKVQNARGGFNEQKNTITETQEKVNREKEKLFLNNLFKDAKSVGLTEVEFAKYSDKIEKAEAYVLERAVRLNRAQIAKSVSAEWKRNEAAVKDEVSTELTTTGRFAVAKFQQDNAITVNPGNADSLAPLFGYDTGAELLAGIDAVNIAQAAEKKNWRRQLQDAIKTETAVRMEERYGNLAENIAQEAREIALADHSFDIMADEVRILAKLANAAPPLAKDELVAWARGSFERSVLTDGANYEKLQRAVAKGGREAEKALLKGDYAEAFMAKQRQMLAATLAKESLRLQRLIDTTEAKIDRFTSEPTIKSIDQGYLEQIREMLGSVGVPQVHAPASEPMALRDFVTVSEGQLAVAPWLFENPPQVKDMTVAQFREFVDSMKSLEHVGRWATKMENVHGEAELQNVVFDAVKALERFPFKDQPTNNPSLGQRIASVGRKIVGMHLLVERALDYTDKFNPHGPLTEWLDRPLRDANAKEITLTEQVVRDLKSLRDFAGPEILEEIPNKLIPDALDKTGFMKMTRQNLRVLMLNMGNWSNMKKLVEGFGVQETDLRRFVDANATKNDVAWVNGVWEVFERLKPEADAVQAKDTGVPVDTIPGVPWDVKAGALKGGYYPLSYDMYNSDIQGHIARPLFDKGYFSAATPHGYTKERTAYTGAIDLSGDFLASKLQGMVHDIAFRLPVRNANKLIENQEFRTAMAQYWGKEVADLMPGWLRDIANSHNLDDNYAKGLMRVSAVIRQNVVSTLIAYNPGTFIKHGFTAAVMSAERVGLGKLLSATGELGLSGALKNAKELAWKSDRLPDEDFMQAYRDLLDQGERGENARQFILDSSAVMRNRQRQYNESIRGAADEITNAGIGQTLAEFRQRQMLYGRMAVAFSDQMSAMPTWLAAYKKAYAAGEGHADAVFIADKEVSRAHGSSFVGDKPLVSRTANTPSGEFARWFTSLYNFWNHQQNNQFQLAWDAAARFRGNPSGEPGANAAAISRRLAVIIGIVMIEELAGPAKDEHGHGLVAQLALATARYLGGGYIGLREVTNALAHGYEPSTGMIGTLSKGMTEVAKDLAKATGQKAGVAKDWVRNTMTAVGFATGVGGAQPGRTGQFIYDVARGADRPKTFNDYRQGLRTGHSKARKFK